MPAQSATLAVLSCSAAAADDLHVDAADCGRLLELLSLVPDPRKRRGVRHSLAAVLAIAAAAVLAGSRSVRAIGEWAAEAPQAVLEALGARYSLVAGRFRAPHIDTIRRVSPLVDAGAADRVAGVFLAGRTGIGAMDSPPGQAGSAAPDGPGDSGPHDHHSQPGQPPRPGENKPLTRGLPVDGKGRARGDPA